MTTTVKLITHAFPVAASISSNHHFSDDQRTSMGHSYSTEFVPANTERSFTITDTTEVSFRELPEGATGLAQPVAAEPANGAQAIG